MKHVEYFVYLGNMIKNDARLRLIREIKSRIVKVKAAFNTKKTAPAN
jgi:hypothetical protein